MKPIKASVSRALPHNARVTCCDNSGARILKVITVKCHKTVKGRSQEAGIADQVKCSVVDGKPEMRKQVVDAVIVRQRKPFRRPDGLHVKFEDNAAVVLKDEFGNPKGTMLKGPIPKEVAERWPSIGKIAMIIV